MVSVAFRRKVTQHLFCRHSSFFIRTPPRTAPREAPTPLVFVSASKWQPESRAGLISMSERFSEQGFTCIETDLDLPPESNRTSEELMEHFETQLKQDIRLSAMIFPPVIFARAAGTLIAQTYVSSNPASGLALISPPFNNKTVPSHLLPSPLPEFDYEPHFPLIIVNTSDRMELFRKKSRFGEDTEVDFISVDDVDHSQATTKLQQWVDELGI